MIKFSGISDLKPGVDRKALFLVTLALASTLILGLPECGSQQVQYPTSPVKMVVAWSAGSGADGAARSLVAGTQKHLGQPITIKNAAGAGGSIGATEVANAKPDGYTIMFTTGSMVIQPHFEQVPYIPGENILPVIQVGGYPLALLVNADSPYKTLKGFIEEVKKNPGKLSYATQAFGGISHLLAEMLWRSAGVTPPTMVPFPSSREGIVAMMGRNVQASFGTPADFLTDVKEGRLRVLGVAMPQRAQGLEDIPTFKEQGYDVVLFGWWGVAVPKGVPEPIRQKLHDSFKKGMDEPPFTDWMSRNKYSKVYLNAADTLALWKREMATYGEIAKTLKK